MRHRIVRAREGDLFEVPPGFAFERIVATEEVPTGAGTTTERWHVMLLRDDRWYLGDGDALAADHAERRTPL